MEPNNIEEIILELGKGEPTTSTTPPGSFTPNDWYWVYHVDEKIYSSKEQNYIESDNDDYLSWLESGNVPTSFPVDDSDERNESEKELEKVLASYGIEMFKPSESDLARKRIGEIKAELEKLDQASIRPASAILAETATDDDVRTLAHIEGLKEQLREEHADLVARISELSVESAASSA